MKVYELIQLLQVYNGDMLVLVDGYEGDLDNINSLERVDVRQKTEDYPGYYGEFEEVKKGDAALVLHRW